MHAKKDLASDLKAFTCMKYPKTCIIKILCDLRELTCNSNGNQNWQVKKKKQGRWLWWLLHP